MLRTGDVVDLPGMHAVVTAVPADPAMDNLEMDITLAPGALGAPPHRHPSLTEEYRVVSGSLEVLKGDTWQTVAHGEQVTISPQTIHTFRNRSSAPVVVHNSHRPAGGFIAYWEELSALARSGKALSMSHPGTIIRLSMLMMAHRDALIPTGFVGRVMMPAAAWVGRRLNVEPAPHSEPARNL